MSKQKALHLLSGLLFMVWMAHPGSAQVMGEPITVDHEPVNRYDMITAHYMVDDKLFIHAIPKKKEKGREQLLVFSYDTKQRGAMLENLITCPDLDGTENFISSFFSFSNRLWKPFTAWDRKTGLVDLYVQEYSNELDEIGPPLKYGTVPLDPRSYNGSTLYVEPIPSHDKSKLLLYFDAIKMDDIKLAMCWVMDSDMTPVWSGSYKLPLQSLGARTRVQLLDNGKVRVLAKAVELNEDNTKQTKDGELKVNVEKKVNKHDSFSLFMMHGEEFSKIDIDIPGAIRVNDYEFLHTDEGRTLLALVEMANGDKGSEHALVQGVLGPEGVTILNTRRLGEHGAGILLQDEDGPLYLRSREKDQETLTWERLDEEGSRIWNVSSPFPYDNVFLHQGYPIAAFFFSKDNVERLRSQKKTHNDTQAYIRIATLVSWKDGQRTIIPLIDEDSGYKETTSQAFGTKICDEGVLYRKNGQKAPSFTFVPVEW